MIRIRKTADFKCSIWLVHCFKLWNRISQRSLAIWFRPTVLVITLAKEPWTLSKLVFPLVPCLPRQLRTSSVAIRHVVWLSPSTSCSHPTSSSPTTSLSVFLLSFSLHSSLDYSSENGAPIHYVAQPFSSVSLRLFLSGISFLPPFVVSVH